MKKISLSWIDNKDIHLPTDEPKLAHVEGSSQEKPCLGFFKPVGRFGAIFVPLRIPYRIGKC